MTSRQTKAKKMMTTRTFKPTLTKDELNELEAETYNGNIHIVNTEEEAKAACSNLMKQKIVGFDTETRPSFTKGETHHVALMQISDSTDCYLFRLNLIGMPKCVASFLKSKKVKKIGLSTKDDFRALSQIKEDLKPDNFIELQNYVTTFGIEEKSLSKIYAIVFGKRISKGQRLSNWEAEELSAKQQLYAALDAYATRQIFIELEGITE